MRAIHTNFELTNDIYVNMRVIRNMSFFSAIINSQTSFNNEQQVYSRV